MTIRSLVKETVYGFAHLTGVPLLARKRRRDALTVLTYHSVGEAGEFPYLHRMPASRFQSQLAYLKDRFDIVSIEEGLARLAVMDAAALNAPPFSRPMACVTVDDGFGDNFTNLFPLIRAAGVPVTIFLATDYLDTGRLPWPTRISALLHYATTASTGGPDNLPLTSAPEKVLAGRQLRQRLKRLGHVAREAALQDLERAVQPSGLASAPPLTWGQVREMSAAGVCFGAHTHHHGWLDCLEASEIDAELALSKSRIEAETGKPCTLLAYPNGNWNAAVAAATQRAGYVAALTQDTGANRRNGLATLALKRIEVPYNERLGTFACRVGGVAL